MKFKKFIICLSSLLTAFVLLFVLLRLMGILIWVNGEPLDKWIALIGLIAMPVSISILSKKIKLNKKKESTLLNIVVFANLLYLLGSFSILSENYTFIKSGKYLSSPYVIHEKEPFQWPKDEYESKYTFYSSLNSFIYIKNSVQKGNQGLSEHARYRDYSVKVISGSLYITWTGGSIFIR
ncbi:hypothetical protein [Peribacillus muralis]|uniref:hypothetical protein n=1 Tax=Peribacillus muralis TaxID=264697 RepID=UPI00070BBC11|nr:hypothetical protein [Peribacillus muralis]